MANSKPVANSTTGGLAKTSEWRACPGRVQWRPSDLRSRLRASTREIHERVEQQLDLDRCLSSLEAYRSTLEDLLSVHRPIERALAGLALETVGIDFEARRKVGWLIADLVDLGHPPAALEYLADFGRAPSPATPEEAIGVLYVLEGSSLGGQVILRRLGPALGIGPLWAGRFFNGYGQATGAMWRTFVARLCVRRRSLRRARHRSLRSCNIYGI